MEAMARKLKEEAKSVGNPFVVDMPCYLHPTHTSFQKMVESLESEIVAFLVNVHGFFKLSTARREDQTLCKKT